VKRIVILGASVLALAACGTQPVPNSAQGVGFNDYALYEVERAQREAQLRGTAFPRTTTPTTAIVPPTAAIVPPTSGAVQSNTVQSNAGLSTAELAAAGIFVDGGGAAPRAAATNTAAAPIGGNADISDEQDFRAVTSRESIESDAQRRARQAQAYQLIEATDLPDRNGSAGPNIVQFALQAPNNLGESVFNRSGFNADTRFARNCAKYGTPDDAQRDFISAGGPQRDRMGIDPDGDGFACGWDPQPFRVLAGN